MTLRRPFSVQSFLKAKLAEDGKESTTQRRLVLENGHPGVEIDEAAIRRGENPYTKYYVQQGEQMPSSGGSSGPAPNGTVCYNLLSLSQLSIRFEIRPKSHGDFYRHCKPANSSNIWADFFLFFLQMDVAAGTNSLYMNGKNRYAGRRIRRCRARVKLSSSASFSSIFYFLVFVVQFASCVIFIPVLLGTGCHL